MHGAWRDAVLMAHGPSLMRIVSGSKARAGWWMGIVLKVLAYCTQYIVLHVAAQCVEQPS